MVKYLKIFAPFALLVFAALSAMAADRATLIREEYLYASAGANSQKLQQINRGSDSYNYAKNDCHFSGLAKHRRDIPLLQRLDQRPQPIASLWRGVGIDENAEVSLREFHSVIHHARGIVVFVFYFHEVRRFRRACGLAGSRSTGRTGRDAGGNWDLRDGCLLGEQAPA